MSEFNYEQAFSRNLGWVTESEQQILRHKRVAIAGAGGVGGIHALTMARLGIANFSLADFDEFGVENINRQVGAMMSTIGQAKQLTIANMVWDINPEADIRGFDQGINIENVDDFLDGVDFYIDSLDFFAMEARRLVFARCAEKGIPAVTAAPLGMGTAVLYFAPDGMTFEQYFQMDGSSEYEQYLRFYLGLAPLHLHSEYLVDATKLDLKAKKGPSLGLGCTMAAAVAGSVVFRVLLGRGQMKPVPSQQQWDPFLNRFEEFEMKDGASNPLFLEALAAAKQHFGI